MERVFDSNLPDPHELDKAKKLLKVRDVTRTLYYLYKRLIKSETWLLLLDDAGT